MRKNKQGNKGSVVEQSAGALKSDFPALSPREERTAAEDAIAEEAIKRMGR
jgi:hypothetical protein